MQKIEITKIHCELMGDLFINDLLDPKKIEYSILPEMKRCLGVENATISVSLALQKCGLEDGVIAGAIAGQLTGYEKAPLVFTTERLEQFRGEK